MSDKMFPMQTSRDVPPGPIQIPWSIAEKAYGAYAQKYGRSQSLERLAQRGGFSWCEMDTLYPAWRTEVSEVARLAAKNTELRKRLEWAESIAKPFAESVRTLPMTKTVNGHLVTNDTFMSDYERVWGKTLTIGHCKDAADFLLATLPEPPTTIANKTEGK